MLVALALTLAAPDHWLSTLALPINAMEGHAHPESRNTADAHSRHCHGNAASCSDVPLTTIGGLALLAAWLLGKPAELWRRLSPSEQCPVGHVSDVSVPPPRLWLLPA